MNLDEIKRILQLMEENKLVEFEYEDEGRRLKLRRADDRPHAPVSIAVPAPVPLAVVPPAAPEGNSRPANVVEFKSPLVGTFYISPKPDADPFDLLCHIAYNAPLRTRRERAEMLKREKQDFFEEYGPQAREVLAEILEKYIEYGTAQFEIPDILKVPPISHRGTVVEIAALFGGAPKLRTAVQKMQTLLYTN